jgi:hypothetical protein
MLYAGGVDPNCLASFGCLPLLLSLLLPIDLMEVTLASQSTVLLPHTSVNHEWLTYSRVTNAKWGIGRSNSASLLKDGGADEVICSRRITG